MLAGFENVRANRIYPSRVGHTAAFVLEVLSVVALHALRQI